MINKRAFEMGRVLAKQAAGPNPWQQGNTGGGQFVPPVASQAMAPTVGAAGAAASGAAKAVGAQAAGAATPAIAGAAGKGGGLAAGAAGLMGGAGTAIGNGLKSMWGRSPMGTVGALGLGALVAPSLWRAGGHIVDSITHGIGNHMDADDQHTKDLAEKNMDVSRRLQALRGAFAPAPNPWGQS